MFKNKQSFLVATSICLTATVMQAGELATAPSKMDSKVAQASDEGEMAIKKFKAPPGFKMDLFAAEPHLANPVAFDVDNQSNFYVSETFRLHAGVTDIRGHMNWLDEDLANRTVDDRIAMMKRHLGKDFPSVAENSDRVKLIIDSNGDGKADDSTVFADGFNAPADGIAAGVLARAGKVWFANLPNLWLLEDENKDGVADKRTSLSYGYGVRVGFLGHDLHGLIFGPDGKIYFSIGDRGSNVEKDGKRIGHPDTGSVFRCNPDGSDLEEYAFGLRNPQELAFDQYGNLFTGDNNSDGGDRARWVYVVEGGDSGWRVGFQFLERPISRGPWNAEKLWHPQWPGQAAYIIPPITNITDGPSGLAYYPGTGMPDKYKEHFFLADFKGGPGSLIHSFAVKPKGAGFEVVDHEKFLTDALPTDVAFGPGGGLHFSDWVQGWGMTGKGRLYHVYDPEVQNQQIVQETRKLLAEGMAKKGNDALARLLQHPNMKVRMEAQFELAERGGRAANVLARVAKGGASTVARLHGIWGLGQIAAKTQAPGIRKSVPPTLEPVMELTRDRDPEIRAQAVRLLSDHRIQALTNSLPQLLEDSSPRVRFHAAMAVGKLQDKSSIPAVLNMLRSNQDKDVYLRHAGAMALTWNSDMDLLMAHAKDKSSSVRMAVLLAMRRLERAEIALFLQDQEPLIVAEAARAINDLPISGAIPDLAALEMSSNAPAELIRRVINANLRFGMKDNAARLAAIANDSSLAPALKAEALRGLENWENPGGRDVVTGLWRPLAAARSLKDGREAMDAIWPAVLDGTADDVRISAIRAASKLKAGNLGEPLGKLGADRTANPNVRVEALKALAASEDPKLIDLLQSLRDDPSEPVRNEALRIQSQLKPANVLGQLAETLSAGSIGEKQSVLATLGNMTEPGAGELVSEAMDQLIAGKLPKEIHLDVLEAAATRKEASVHSKLEKFTASLPKDDELAEFRSTLHGGNAEEGRKVFFERAEASCLRCHKIKGEGEGGEVGPDLTGYGAKQSREYILESIVLPNKQIAEGFQSLIVNTKSGTAVAGIVKSENDQELVLNSPEDGIVTIKKSEITDRTRGISGMPEGFGAILSKRDLRNLVEFLSVNK
ncbi:MAG: PVC-type heme-binding CxxCH protein [Verrucomicrobiales bacterium]